MPWSHNQSEAPRKSPTAAKSRPRTRRYTANGHGNDENTEKGGTDSDGRRRRHRTDPDTKEATLDAEMYENDGKTRHRKIAKTGQAKKGSRGAQAGSAAEGGVRTACILDGIQ